MEDTEILNQPAGTEEQTDIEHFILDHAAIEQSIQLLQEINDHLTEVNGVSISMEGIALESIGEKIKEYWQKFLAWLKKIWAKIMHFFEMHFTVLGRRRLHINRMLTKIKSLSTNPNIYQKLHEGKEMQLAHDGAKAFTIGDRTCNDFASLEAAMQKTALAVQCVTNDYGQYITNRGMMIGKSIASATQDTARGLFSRIVTDIDNNPFQPREKLMLGNVELIYDPAHSGQDEQGRSIMKLDARRLELQDKPIVSHEVHMFTPMKIDELAKIYTAMGGILDQMDAFKNGEYKKIVDMSKTLMTGTDKFVNTIYHLADAEGGVNTYEDMLALNKNFLSWIKGPTMELIRSITMTFFHLGLEAEHNISLYTQTEASNLFSIMGLM